MTQRSGLPRATVALCVAVAGPGILGIQFACSEAPNYSSLTSGSGGAASAAQTSTAAGQGNAGGGGGEGGSGCPAGEVVCISGEAATCDGKGGFTDFMECGILPCKPGIGCFMTCTPGTAQCVGAISQTCTPDSTAWVSAYCDPADGQSCDAATGKCVGPCVADGVAGCEFLPTVLPNVQLDEPFNFAVAISGASKYVSDVTITLDGNPVASATVFPGEATVLILPWVSSLKAAKWTDAYPKSAYRLKASHPIVAYQHNPIEYELGNTYSYTNDASLLFPVSAWRESYVVTAWPGGYYAVVASEDDTVVTPTPPSGGSTVDPGVGIAADGTGSVTLGAGDVLLVFSPTGDVTGTFITANKPVQVIGGHDCANVPQGVKACDHLEESMPPTETLSTEYLVAAPRKSASMTVAPNVVRIVATAPNTNLTYDPPQPGLPTTLAAAGDFAQAVSATADFSVSASERILVAQYMEGQELVGSGDPSMTIAVSKDQFRTSYIFHAPMTYATNYANVIAEVGAVIQLDGMPVVGSTPIGASGYEVTRVNLGLTPEGIHRIEADSPFGLSVYGYGLYTSYWYPGGQNLVKTEPH